MTKIATAKYKVSRRLGKSLWGRTKDSFNTRAKAPGQHGEAAARKKHSDFGVQLRAKQQMKAYYNMMERQFRAIYKEAIRRKGDSSENLVSLLERRLDAVVYRANFAPTIFAAKQLVSHKHILVNGKKVNIPSYKVVDGDEISVVEKARSFVPVIEAAQKKERDLPSYVEATDAFTVKFVRAPQFTDIPYPVQMEPNLVIEFYSR